MFTAVLLNQYIFILIITKVNENYTIEQFAIKMN